MGKVKSFHFDFFSLGNISNEYNIGTISDINIINNGLLLEADRKYKKSKITVLRFILLEVFLITGILDPYSQYDQYRFATRELTEDVGQVKSFLLH